MLLKFSRGLHWTSGFACHSTQPCGFAPEKLRPLLESAFSENSVPRVEPWSFVCCLSAPSPLFQMLLFECLARICKLPSHVPYQLDSRRLLPVRATEGSWEDMNRVEEIFFFLLLIVMIVTQVTDAATAPVSSFFIHSQHQPRYLPQSHEHQLAEHKGEGPSTSSAAVGDGAGCSLRASHHTLDVKAVLTSVFPSPPGRSAFLRLLIWLPKCSPLYFLQLSDVGITDTLSLKGGFFS